MSTHDMGNNIGKSPAELSLLLLRLLPSFLPPVLTWPLALCLACLPYPCARVPCRLRGAALAGRVMTLNTKPGLLSMRMPGACLLLYSVHTTCTRQQGWPRVEWG